MLPLFANRDVRRRKARAGKIEPLAEAQQCEYNRQMQSMLLALAALLIATIAPEQAIARPLSCPGFPEETGSSPNEIDSFYAVRAAAIVRAGLASDMATLGIFVSPKARFATWRRDYSTGGRQIGAAGATEWAQDMAPSRFESLIDQPGPISITPLKCERTTTLLFRTRAAGKGVNVTFEFRDGLLVQATGHEVLLLEGDLR